jgi:hypothetical protein
MLVRLFTLLLFNGVVLHVLITLIFNKKSLKESMEVEMIEVVRAQG